MLAKGAKLKKNIGKDEKILMEDVELKQDDAAWAMFRRAIEVSAR